MSLDLKTSSCFLVLSSLTSKSHRTVLKSVTSCYILCMCIIVTSMKTFQKDSLEMRTPPLVIKAPNTSQLD